ncbi:MAG: hypothetical protein AB1792_04100 [Candidatus Zixiibacteriota bacterium]
MARRELTGRSWSKGILSTMLLAGALALACSDKGTEPKPGSYRLYVAKTGDPEGWVAVIDCATDSVVDTLRYGFQRDGMGIVASPDGKYLAVTGSGRRPLIWDVAGGAPIGYLSVPMMPPAFLPDIHAVVGTPFDSTLVYSLPTLAPTTTWPVELIWAEKVPGKPWVMGIDQRQSSVPNDDESKLAIFDYQENQEIDSVIIEPDDQGVGFQVTRFTLSPDGRRLYAVGGGAGGGPSLIGYDLERRQVVFRRALSVAVGYCRVTPDGREVWVSEHGFLWQTPIYPGHVIAFDAQSGHPLDTIKTDGLGPTPNDGLAVLDIRFLPSGEKAYVNTYHSGPVLVIDVRTHTIERFILTSGGSAHAIDLAPVP